MTENLDIQSEVGFSSYLSRFGIPVDQWGKGSAKTVGHLMREINDGETVLTRNGGELFRSVGFVAVNVTYRNGSEVYELVEDRQEFQDGRSRRRNMASSVSEKMLPNENPKDAAERALREELGITGRINLKGGSKSEEIKESPSYPGLRTQYQKYGFSVELNEDQYSPDGYVEYQDDKTTFFAWQKR